MRPISCNRAGCLRRTAAGATLIAAVVLAAGPARAQSSGPVYHYLRYDDDFRYLRTPDHPEDFWDPVKDIQFGNALASYLSLGGELRERVQSYSDPLFGLKRQGSDTYLQHRLLLHGDLHVSDEARVFLQLGNALEYGKTPPLASTDIDRLDLQQGFVELRSPEIDRGGPVLRAGRQEFAFGSQRLVSPREGSNVRRSFDGFRALETVGALRVDAFVTRPVQLRQSYFDDQPDHSQAFWGIYATAPVRGVPHLNADLYYLGFENDAASYGGVRAAEHRHSAGTRLFGTAGPWDWDFEGVGQVGSFGGRDIWAWNVASDSGWTLTELPWHPRLGLRADIASGDHDPHDGKLGTFNPLFPKLRYFNLTTLIMPANIYDVYPQVTVRPDERVSVMLGWDFLWRASTRDAVYTSPPLTPIPGTSQSSGRRIGDQIAFEAQYRVDAHLTLIGSFVHFDAGDAIRQAGGRNVDFVTFSTLYRF